MLYKNTVKQSNYIRHALGGLDTYQYLNTIEALENSYKKVLDYLKLMLDLRVMINLY